MKKILVLVFVSCVASACSSNTIDMTYNCNPPGATVFEDGTRELGACPVTVQYHPNDAQIREGKFYTKKITAVWPNGALASTSSLTVDIPSSGQAYYTLTSAQAMAVSVPEVSGVPNMLAPTTVPMPEMGEMSAPDSVAVPVFQPAGPAQPSTQPVIMQNNPPMMAPPNASQGVPPNPTPVFEKHQDQDFFDSLNRDLTCKVDDLISSVYSGCPGQGSVR